MIWSFQIRFISPLTSDYLSNLTLTGVRPLWEVVFPEIPSCDDQCFPMNYEQCIFSDISKIITFDYIDIFVKPIMYMYGFWIESDCEVIILFFFGWFWKIQYNVHIVMSLKLWVLI